MEGRNMSVLLTRDNEFFLSEKLWRRCQNQNKPHRGQALQRHQSGKVKFKHAYARHMFSSQDPAEKARLRKNRDSRKADAAKVRALMPYADDPEPAHIIGRTKLRCLASKADQGRAVQTTNETRSASSAAKTLKQARSTLEKGLTYAYRSIASRRSAIPRTLDRAYQRLARENGISYSALIDGLKKAGVDVDRKMLAALAIDATPCLPSWCAPRKARSALKQQHKSRAAKSRAPGTMWASHMVFCFQP